MSSRTRLVVHIGLTVGITIMGSSRLEANAELEEFACKTYDNGAVPFGKAQALVTTPADVQILRAILHNHQKGNCWYSAVMALGAAGSPEAVKVLEDFVSGGDEKLSPEQYDGKSGAILALGWAANPVGRKNFAGSKEAFEYLQKAIGEEGSQWENIKWSSPFHANGAALAKSLTGRAIEALGLSGRDQARDILTQSTHCKTGPSERNVLYSTCKAALDLIPRAKDGLGKMYP